MLELSSVDGAPIPGAPDAMIPPVNSSDGTSAGSNCIEWSKDSNAAATDTVSGFTTLTHQTLRTPQKEQSIVKVEYYNGEELVQTVTQAPFALDTTKLQNGQYTITERTSYRW